MIVCVREVVYLPWEPGSLPGRRCSRCSMCCGFVLDHGSQSMKAAPPTKKSGEVAPPSCQPCGPINNPPDKDDDYVTLSRKTDLRAPPCWNGPGPR